MYDQFVVWKIVAKLHLKNENDIQTLSVWIRSISEKSEIVSLKNEIYNLEAYLIVVYGTKHFLRFIIFNNPRENILYNYNRFKDIISKAICAIVAFSTSTTRKSYNSSIPVSVNVDEENLRGFPNDRCNWPCKWRRWPSNLDRHSCVTCKVDEYEVGRTSFV